MRITFSVLLKYDQKIKKYKQMVSFRLKLASGIVVFIVVTRMVLLSVQSSGKNSFLSQSLSLLLRGRIKKITHVYYRHFRAIYTIPFFPWSFGGFFHPNFCLSFRGNR